MKNIQIKKIIFGFMAVSYVALTTYSMVVDKTVPAEFIAVVTGVFGYYFGYGKGEKDNTGVGKDGDN